MFLLKGYEEFDAIIACYFDFHILIFISIVFHIQLHDHLLVFNTSV